MDFLARITEDKRKQLLSTHLLQVAKKCSTTASDTFQDVAYYAGLWHDLGKYRQEWQKYLLGDGKREYHAPHGAMLALRNSDKVPAIAYIIAGHHTGLHDKAHLESRDFEQYAQGWGQAVEAAKQEIPDFVPEKLPDINLAYNRREFAIRMLFSVLVDADRFSRSKSFPEPLPAVHLSLGTQFVAILLESAFQGTGVVGGLRVQCKRSRSSAPKCRLKP
ncbi:CRISPR-associated endonuclease Cas3'' [Nostoc sp. CHAB 5784]|uniref:CRISPR-associated endonuclease Cas3'' n=1 Tax=Nostoc mirabile TaxID=2907820 RepID=UPI001E46B6CB|nr:CRISPR-associated endonuclease Cas3'' [Nostoc mirabile]MCC5670390.1 CRISPR-associated endonuclease Cas3'' [Nostoc mirabile CHAB5784]